MKNKKHRPYYAWLLLGGILVFAIFCAVSFSRNGELDVTLIVLIIALSICFLYCTTFFIQIKDDKIIFKQGFRTSKGLAKTLLFKPRTILVKDIAAIYVDAEKKEIHLILTDNELLTLIVLGYISAQEIMDEFLQLDIQPLNTPLE